MTSYVLGTGGSREKGEKTDHQIASITFSCSISRLVTSWFCYYCQPFKEFWNLFRATKSLAVTVAALELKGFKRFGKRLYFC